MGWRKHYRTSPREHLPNSIRELAVAEAKQAFFEPEPTPQRSTDNIPAHKPSAQDPCAVLDNSPVPIASLIGEHPLPCPGASDKHVVRAASFVAAHANWHHCNPAECQYAKFWHGVFTNGLNAAPLLRERITSLGSSQDGYALDVADSAFWKMESIAMRDAGILVDAPAETVFSKVFVVHKSGTPQSDQQLNDMVHALSWRELHMVVQGKARGVHDLRHPNRFMHDWPFAYPSLLDVRKAASRAERASSIDIRAAFHHIPLAVECRHLYGLGGVAPPSAFARLPFGWKLAPVICCAFTAELGKQLTWILRRFTGDNASVLREIMVYVDDMLFLWSGQPPEGVMDVVLRHLASLGVSVAIEKLIQPTRAIEYLGIRWRVGQNGSAQIPQEKADRARALLCWMLRQHTPTVTAWRSIVGLLNWFCQIDWSMRASMPTLYGRLLEHDRNATMAPLSRVERTALTSWCTRLLATHPLKTDHPDTRWLVIGTDAAINEGQATWGGFVYCVTSSTILSHWRGMRLPAEAAKASAVAELWGTALAVGHAVDRWPKAGICTISDASAAVYGIRRGYLRGQPQRLGQLLVACLGQIASNHTPFISKWCPRTQHTAADYLSRRYSLQDTT